MRISEKQCNLCGSFGVRKSYCKACQPTARRLNTNKQITKLRLKLIKFYGGICACCREAREAFLCLDHINGGGHAHRKLVKGGTHTIWRDALKPGKETIYRLLCYNCNMATRWGATCPHQIESDSRDSI